MNLSRQEQAAIGFVAFAFLFVFAIGGQGLALFQRPTPQVVGGATSGGTAVALLTDASGNLGTIIAAGTAVLGTVRDTPAMSGYTTDFDYPLTAVVSVSTTTAITSTTTLVQQIYANNSTGGAVTLTIANSAGTEATSAFSIPANSNLNLSFPAGLTFTNGISAKASASNSINLSVRGKQ